MLMGTEEINYNKAMEELETLYLNYYKEMDRRGYMNHGEKKFLKQGVMFSTIKLAIFGMRPDEITERTTLIKMGQYEKMRPSNRQSNKRNTSDKSKRSYHRRARHGPVQSMPAVDLLPTIKNEKVSKVKNLVAEL